MSFYLTDRLRRRWRALRRGLPRGDNPVRRPLPAALRIVAGLASLIVIGTMLLMLPGMGAERNLTFIEALFTAVSALSVTGLSIITPSQDLSLLGQITLLVLIQVGGVGFMVMAVAFFALLGRRVAIADRIALTNALGLLSPGGIIQLTQRVILGVLSFEAVGALLLWLHWRDELGAGRALFYAIFHAVSAFCNAGFDLFTGLPEYPNGIPTDNVTLLILGTIIFCGGLGIPVISDLLLWRTLRRLSLHTRITLVVALSLLLAGGLGMFIAEREAGGMLHGEHWLRQLVLAFFQSVSARTAGFAALQPFDQITPASQMLLLPLMLIGASPASMGGGMTTGTFAVLAIALWSFARGRSQAFVGGRQISQPSIQKAGAVLTISLIVVSLATWLLLLTNPHVGLDAAMFEVFSAFATCGLTLGLTGNLNTAGHVIIMLVMFWGRLGALTIVVALATQALRPELVRYPEEPVLIG